MAESMRESDNSDSNSSCAIIDLQKTTKLDLNFGTNTVKMSENGLNIETSPLVQKFESGDHSAAMTMKVSPAVDVRKSSPSRGSRG